MNPNRRKVKVKNVKAADPGLSFDIFTDDQQPFGSALEIFVSIYDVQSGPQFTHHSKISIFNTITENSLTVLAPFGDYLWSTNQGHQIEFDIQVHFSVPNPSPSPTSGSDPVESSTGNRVTASEGKFCVEICEEPE